MDTKELIDQLSKMESVMKEASKLIDKQKSKIEELSSEVIRFEYLKEFDQMLLRGFIEMTQDQKQAFVKEVLEKFFSSKKEELEK